MQEYQVDLLLGVHQTGLPPESRFLFLDGQQGSSDQVLSEDEVEVQVVGVGTRSDRVVADSDWNIRYLRLGNILNMLSRSSTMSCPII